MLARKLVNMPDGMLAIIKTFNYRMVEPSLGCCLLWSENAVWGMAGSGE
jgi:hypothetical protein